MGACSAFEFEEAAPRSRELLEEQIANHGRTTNMKADTGAFADRTVRVDAAGTTCTRKWLAFLGSAQRHCSRSPFRAKPIASSARRSSAGG